jgi:hypothetical protein
LFQGPATLHLRPGCREEMVAPPLPHFLVRHELHDQLGQLLGSFSQAYVGPDRRVEAGDCGTGSRPATAALVATTGIPLEAADNAVAAVSDPCRSGRSTVLAPSIVSPGTPTCNLSDAPHTDL